MGNVCLESSAGSKFNKAVHLTIVEWIISMQNFGVLLVDRLRMVLAML